MTNRVNEHAISPPDLPGSARLPWLPLGKPAEILTQTVTGSKLTEVGVAMDLVFQWVDTVPVPIRVSLKLSPHGKNQVIIRVFLDVDEPSG